LPAPPLHTGSGLRFGLVHTPTPAPHTPHTHTTHTLLGCRFAHIRFDHTYMRFAGSSAFYGFGYRTLPATTCPPPHTHTHWYLRCGLHTTFYRGLPGSLVYGFPHTHAALHRHTPHTHWFWLPHTVPILRLHTAFCLHTFGSLHTHRFKTATLHTHTAHTHTRTHARTTHTHTPFTHTHTHLPTHTPRFVYLYLGLVGFWGLFTHVYVHTGYAHTHTHTVHAHPHLHTLVGCYTQVPVTLPAHCTHTVYTRVCTTHSLVYTHILHTVVALHTFRVYWFTHTGLHGCGSHSTFTHVYTQVGLGWFWTTLRLVYPLGSFYTTRTHTFAVATHTRHTHARLYLLPLRALPCPATTPHFTHAHGSHAHTTHALVLSLPGLRGLHTTFW